MSIILWIISAFLWSLGGAYQKKSISHSALPNWLFILFWPITWIILIYSLLFMFWFESDIFSNYSIVWLLILAWIFDWFWWLLEISILKKIKISKILPYSSFDKLFIILIWFTIFYWKPWYTSITTLFVAIFTFIVILWLSLDYKNLKLDKDIIHFILVKLLYAISTLLIWSVMFSYTTMDVFAIMTLVYFSFHFIINYLMKKDFKQIFKQTKTFYKYRLISSIVSRLWFVLWFFIIETSWVMVASLLSFITIVFSIFTMKFILKDNPSKKQIILAFLVSILIWIWYYFK